MNPDLFQSEPNPQWLELNQARLMWLPEFLSRAQADLSFTWLMEQVPWKQEEIQLFGQRHLQPRLQAWYGDKPYTYSGLTLSPLAWQPELLALKGQCEQVTGHTYNSLLANLYRDGQDSMGWHQDNEPELGTNPTIASLTLGATRRFSLKHKSTGERYQLDLGHGSLLIMSGETQTHWLHQVAKSSRVCQPRINLTFRNIL